jgi:hypothetical protein
VAIGLTNAKNRIKVTDNLFGDVSPAVQHRCTDGSVVCAGLPLVRLRIHKQEHTEEAHPCLYALNFKRYISYIERFHSTYFMRNNNSIIIIIMLIIIINMLMPASSDCFTHLKALLVLQEARH